MTAAEHIVIPRCGKKASSEMNLHRLFIVSVEGGVALVSPDVPCNTLRLLGSSAMTPVAAGAKCESVAIYPTEGEKVLLAFGGGYAEYFNGKLVTHGNIAVWVGANWKDGKLEVELSRESVPLKPAEIFRDHIEVVIGEERFSSAEEVAPGMRQVDGHTLCQYLVWLK
jgi:hypothetical protein